MASVGDVSATDNDNGNVAYLDLRAMIEEVETCKRYLHPLTKLYHTLCHKTHSSSLPLILIVLNVLVFVVPGAFCLWLLLISVVAMALLGYVHHQTNLLVRFIPNEGIATVTSGLVPTATENITEQEAHEAFMCDYREMLLALDCSIRQINSWFHSFYTVFKWNNVHLTLRYYTHMCILVCSLHVVSPITAICVCIDLIALDYFIGLSTHLRTQNGHHNEPIGNQHSAPVYDSLSNGSRDSRSSHDSDDMMFEDRVGDDDDNEEDANGDNDDSSDNRSDSNNKDESKAVDVESNELVIDNLSLDNQSIDIDSLSVNYDIVDICDVNTLASATSPSDTTDGSAPSASLDDDSTAASSAAGACDTKVTVETVNVAVTQPKRKRSPAEGNSGKAAASLPESSEDFLVKKRRTCIACGVTFSTILKRRHTCNHCGNQFCNKCCSQKVPRSLLGATAPTAHTETVAVCTFCYTFLTADGNKLS